MASDNPWGMNPRKARGGVKARSQRGEFAQNWWARRWIQALERLVSGPRLARGKHYARLGQVMAMDEIKGGITAMVQGTRPKPYKVTIKVTSFNDEQWNKVLDVLADQAVFVAQLLAGEMPTNIEDAFAAAGVSLFPVRTSDLLMSCSCPDPANPCKHIAAAHYILGDRFDEDPFLIFRMRGRSQDQILRQLRRRRGEPEIEPAPAPEPVLEAAEAEDEEGDIEVEIPVPRQSLAQYWRMGPGLEEIQFQVKAPEIPRPVLKRLGEPDAASTLTLDSQLEDAYQAISQFALLLAYGEAGNTPAAEEETSTES